MDVFSVSTYPVIFWMFVLSLLLVIADTLTKKESNTNMLLCLLGLAGLSALSIYNIATDNNFIYNSVTGTIMDDFIGGMLFFNNTNA